MTYAEFVDLINMPSVLAVIFIVTFVTAYAALSFLKRHSQ